jgi:hypothetical protein
MEDWQRYLADDDEGLGTVYERFVLNDLLVGYHKRFGFDSALEAPVYGMTGLTGINGAELSRAGCALTLVDTDPERAKGVEQAWDKLGLGGRASVRTWDEADPLPFDDGAFPFAFNFAALWHLRRADSFMAELARVCSGHLFIAMPNPLQLGYLMRKRWLEPEFFERIDERWTRMSFLKQTLGGLGFRCREEGVFDVPPWPDTCLPVGELLQRMGLKRRSPEPMEPGPKSWSWSIVSYYRDGDTTVKRKVDRILRLAPESWPLPWRLKLVWAHHRYVLAEKAL